MSMPGISLGKREWVYLCMRRQTTYNDQQGVVKWLRHPAFPPSAAHTSHALSLFPAQSKKGKHVSWKEALWSMIMMRSHSAQPWEPHCSWAREIRPPTCINAMHVIYILLERCCIRAWCWWQLIYYTEEWKAAILDTPFCACLNIKAHSLLCYCQGRCNGMMPCFVPLELKCSALMH